MLLVAVGLISEFLSFALERDFEGVLSCIRARMQGRAGTKNDER